MKRTSIIFLLLLSFLSFESSGESSGKMCHIKCTKSLAGKFAERANTTKSQKEALYKDDTWSEVRFCLGIRCSIEDTKNFLCKLLSKTNPDSWAIKLYAQTLGSANLGNFHANHAGEGKEDLKIYQLANDDKFISYCRGQINESKEKFRRSYESNFNKTITKFKNMPVEEAAQNIYSAAKGMGLLK